MLPLGIPPRIANVARTALLAKERIELDHALVCFCGPLVSERPTPAKQQLSQPSDLDQDYYAAIDLGGNPGMPIILSSSPITKIGVLVEHLALTKFGRFSKWSHGQKQH